jgi:hypothetical protein
METKGPSLREELLNNEDKRIDIIQEDLEKWAELGEKVHTEYISFIKDLQKERREMFKYLGTISGGAAALAPQLLSNVQQPNFFYAGIGLLCLVVIISTTYILSTIENEASEFLKDLKEKNEVFDRLRKPKRNFLVEGDYSVGAFVKALSENGENELPTLIEKVEASKSKKGSWYTPMDYTGEFVILFIVVGLSLLALSLSDYSVAWSLILWISVSVFIIINTISTFPTKIFSILGAPVDLVKSLIRYIFKKA